MEKRQGNQDGSVLLVTLVLAVAFGGIVSASLLTMVSQNRKLSKRHLADQVELLAQGELEIAKNIVNASGYDVYMQNEVLKAAIGSTNKLIPNTNVVVSRIGTSEYFVLRAQASRHGMTGRAEAVCRQVSPASSNNLVVISHPVGISGRPRGAIHSNKHIDFYFPGGEYRDQVTASEGFNFVAGATTDNTKLLGPTNGNAPVANPLGNVDFDSLWSKADVLSVTDNLVSEIQLNGTTAEVKLFQPAYTTTETVTETVRVFSHWETEEYIVSKAIWESYTYTETQPVYEDETYTVIESQPVYVWVDRTRTVEEPILEEQTVEYTVEVPVYATRMVETQVEEDVWVPYDSDGATSSGGTVGSTTQLDGYWKTVTVTKEVEETYISHTVEETRTRTDMVQVGTNTYEETYQERVLDHWEDVEVSRIRQVQTGTIDVEKTGWRIIGYEDVTKTRDYKVYKDEERTYERTVEVAESLVRTETVPLNGVMYLKGNVRKLGGTINGRLSLITAGSVQITGDIVYTDDANQTRMLNGKDHTKPYVDNPAYSGNSLLAVMAKGDVLYSTQAPTNLEINASLISAEGSVKYEGIMVSEDGNTVWTEYADGQTHVLTSLRRLGGIVSNKRPICTYINELGYITAGFEYGQSIMDQNLILSSGNNTPPPFMFQAGIPFWIMSTTRIALAVH